MGCGECIDICTVQAIKLEDDLAVVDDGWCIGWGVCATRCEYDALRIRYREDKEEVLSDFETLHKRIQEESG